MFFQHFASKNLLPGLFISGTLAENDLNYLSHNITSRFFLSAKEMNVLLTNEILWISYFQFSTNWVSSCKCSPFEM